MTLENSYKNKLDETLASYKSSYMDVLEPYKTIPQQPTDLLALLTYVKELKEKKSKLQSVVIRNAAFNPQRLLDDHYKALDAEYQNELQSIQSETDSKLHAAQEQYNDEVAEVSEYNTSIMQPFKDKYQELLEYKKDLIDIFNRYQITPLSVELADDITTKEYSVLVDESIAICKKYARQDKDIMDKVLKPLQGETQLQFTAAYVLLLIVCLYFAAPFAMIPAFILLYKSVHGMNQDIDKLKIANSLMSQIDYNRFIDESQLRTVEEFDDSAILSEREERLAAIDNPRDNYDADLSAMQESLGDFNAECAKVTAEVKNEFTAALDNLSKAVDKGQAALDEILKSYVAFPNKQSDRVVMSHNYTLGKIENTIDVNVELPAKNIVIDDTDHTAALKRIKLLLANALLSVRVKQLTVEIFDPKNMGSDFVEFLEPETQAYVKINEHDLKNMLQIYKKYSQENIKALHGKTIDEYNLDAEKRELVPVAYKLLILVSDFAKLSKGDEKELWDEYLTYSADTGVMVWLMDKVQHRGTIFINNDNVPQGKPIDYTVELGEQATKTYMNALKNYRDGALDYEEYYGNKFLPRDTWWTHDTIDGINLRFGLVNGDPTRPDPIKLEGDAVHCLMGGATGAGKSAAINQMLTSLITEYPPSELQLIYIDFKNVEAFKLTRGYVKEENRWMHVVDDIQDKAEREAFIKSGKTDEQEQHIRNEDYFVRRSRVPHFQIISGTTDGEYALSVFDYLNNEMTRRQKIVNKSGKEDLFKARKDILKRYNESVLGITDKKKWHTWLEMRNEAWDTFYKKEVIDLYGGDLPRFLVIFDEFQVMFNDAIVDAKTQDKIKALITNVVKLGRAMGVHLWFTSQSMKGTLSADVLGNFKIRGALRCARDVSEQLLGNDAAGKITSKFGYMYTNDNAGQTKENNKFWRVPFLDGTAMNQKYIDKLYELLEPRREHHNMAEFYDEKVLVPSFVLDEWYKTHGETFKDPRSFIFGERANYSTNRLPCNFRIMDDTGENICIAAFERDDMLNLVMTFIDNIKKSEDYTLIINCADKDAYNMLGIEQLADPRFLSLASPKQDPVELVDTLDVMIQKRAEVGGPYAPVYVMLVNWERATGIGVDTNYRSQDKLLKIMRNGPPVGVHFIMAFREKMDIPKNIIGACKHTFAGLLPTQALQFCESNKAEKLPSASDNCGIFGIYEYGSAVTKFRIYQHKFAAEAESREIVA